MIEKKMHTVMNILVFTLLFNVIIQVQSRNPDYLATFFRTKNPDDLHDEAKKFILIWRNQQRSATDGYSLFD
jgi:hypothetical protein